MSLISLICPVYKAESYLRRCIDSVLSQTYSDWELILVDDGSPDQSGDICDSYASKDNRIRVIHKLNGGVSSARQTGTDAAHGEYTIHIDPDDWVEPTMLEELVYKAHEANADIVICDYFEDSKDGSKVIRQQPSSLRPNSVFRELFQHLHGSCCNKLIRRSCYNDYDISFPQGYTLLEDLYVVAMICTHDVKIAYLSKAFYHYIQDENVNSMVRKPTKNSVSSIIKFCDAFQPIWERYQMQDASYNYRYHAKDFAKNSGKYSKKQIREIFPEINGRLKENALSHWRSEPWKMELLISMYLPKIFAKIYCSLVYKLKR